MLRCFDWLHTKIPKLSFESSCVMAEEKNWPKPSISTAISVKMLKWKFSQRWYRQHRHILIDWKRLIRNAMICFSFLRIYSFNMEELNIFLSKAQLIDSKFSRHNCEGRIVSRRSDSKSNNNYLLINDICCIFLSKSPLLWKVTISAHYVPEHLRQFETKSCSNLFSSPINRIFYALSLFMSISLHSLLLLYYRMNYSAQLFCAK